MKYMIGDECGNMYHEKDNRFCLNEGGFLFQNKKKAKDKIIELAEKINPDLEWQLKVYKVEMIEEG